MSHVRDKSNGREAEEHNMRFIPKLPQIYHAKLSLETYKLHKQSYTQTQTTLHHVKLFMETYT